MLRNTGNTESIIVEYGFLDSSEDDVEQLTNNYENYAEAVVRAIVDYIGATYIPVVGSNYYVVKSGDTLWSIANANNTTVSELKTLNNLSTTALSIGQVLKIPSTQENNLSTYYIVKSGDTLYSIASENNLTVQELMNLNNLTSTTLSIGQKLLLTSSSSDNEQTTYTVVKGDTLYAIANTYGLSIQDIIDANNLSSTALTIGQTLIIPSENTYDTYTVVSGDTVFMGNGEY